MVFNFISHSCIGCLRSFIHETSVRKINDGPMYNGVIHSFSRCFSLDGGNNIIHINSDNFFFILFSLLSFMELSHMSYHIIFSHLFQIICFFILNSGKFEKTLNEGVAISILGEADARIIKVVLPNRT